MEGVPVASVYSGSTRSCNFPRSNPTDTSISILERSVYGVSEAAGLLGLHARRVSAWLDGYERGGRFYEPVIRPEHTGDDIVTWGEFVELGYLREYRRKGVPLQRLRPVIAALRNEYQTLYPLATAQPFVYGRDLVLVLQRENALPDPLAIVVRSGQTVLLADEAERFFRKVEFDSHEAVCRLRPAGSASAVVIDPLIRFGRPSVRGVSTDRLWELYDAGEPLEVISTGYEMPEHDVRAAVAYEEQQRSITA